MKLKTLGVLVALSIGFTLSSASDVSAQTITDFSPLNCFTVDSYGYRTSSDLIYDHEKGHVRRGGAGGTRTLICPIETQLAAASGVFIIIRAKNSSGSVGMQCYFTARDQDGVNRTYSTIVFPANSGPTSRALYINTTSLNTVDVGLYCNSHPGHEIRQLQLIEYP